MASSSASTEAPGRKPIYPPFWFLLSIALMVALHRLAPGARLVGGPARYLGLALLGAGIGVVVWAATIFHRTGTTIKPFEESTALIREGPYRLTRNPIYLSMAIALAGVAVWLGSLTPFAVVPLFGFFIDRRFIRREEAMLERAFGERYAEYRREVRRWI